jgi:hypothetical protein
MLFAHLRSLGLTGSLSDMLSTFVFSALEERVLIDLSPTSGAFYSLGSEFVATGAFEAEIDFLTSSTDSFSMILGGSSAGDYLAIRGGGELRLSINGTVFNQTTGGYNDGVLHTVKISRTGSTVSILVDGVSLLTATNTDSFKVDRVGTWANNSFYFNGIESNLRLTDVDTPANNLEFALNQLTANTETNNGVTATYNNIGTANTIRNTYTLSADGTQLISDLRTIDIAPQPVTENMTLTDSWTVIGDDYTTLGGATSGSARLEAVISNTDSGILMESGGAGFGLIVYVHAGVLYFQCGSGSAFGTSADTAEIAYTLPSGEFNYLVEWSAKTTNAALYINAVKGGSQAFNNSVISGGGIATVGQVNDTVATNRGGWTSNAQGAYTNTITKCDIFLNQVTGDL